jgi:hypothetical protein
MAAESINSAQSGLPSGHGFNEAAAKWPRKDELNTIEYTGGGRASMRPRPNGRGKPPHDWRSDLSRYLLQ